MPDDARTLTAEPSTAVTVHQGGGDLLSNAASFEFGQRVAKLFSSSQLVPQHLRGNPADCFIALHMARRLGEDPLVTMQNIYIVSGRAGWSAQYMIGRANRSGVFKGRITWKTDGGGPEMAVTARATLADTGEEISATASMAMARDEGWVKNAKYKSMPEHMLRWRSATMLIRLYCPEVMLGMQTHEELADLAAAGGMVDVTPAARVEKPDEFEAASAGVEAKIVETHDPVTGEVHETATETPVDKTSENSGSVAPAAAQARDPFWSGDSYALPPPAKNKGWVDFNVRVRDRLKEAETQGEIARLLADNERNMGNYRLANAEGEAALRAAFATRAQEIGEGEG